MIIYANIILFYVKDSNPVRKRLKSIKALKNHNNKNRLNFNVVFTEAKAIYA